MIRELIKTGYRFHLFYFWLPSADHCIKRLYERKSLGGHFVPEETIRPQIIVSFSDKDGKLCIRDAHEIEIPEKYADLEPFRY